MPTYRLDLSYDGSNFRGYAKNRDVRTVQHEVESALGTIFGQRIDTVCAGRTDAGVHARQQVISFGSDRSMDTNRIQRSVNTMFGGEIAATDVMVVPDDFHARFSATMRSYRYRVLTTRAPDPLQRYTVWHQPFDLDLEAMNQAVAHMLGEHDFAAFCRRIQDRPTVRTVFSASWEHDGGLCVLAISAKAFCQQMVRAIAGLTMEIGRGRFSADDVPAMLEARTRIGMPPVAPPGGLILWEVAYH